jgi:hypothetical protein
LIACCARACSSISIRSYGTRCGQAWRAIPKATAPYPTASDPKRSRILSIAQSATQRALPLFVPGRRSSPSSAKGSSNCMVGCCSRFDTEIASREMVFSSACLANTPRTRSTAISASIAVAETGAGSVTERVIERRSAKRTRTVTVRPGRHLARSRVATLSARCQSVGRNMCSSAGFLPSADCAPADCPR